MVGKRNKSGTTVVSVEEVGWGKAITDATELLKKVEAKARRLRVAILTFQEEKKAGVPYHDYDKVK